MVQASREPDRHPNIIARSVQKAAAVENSSLIMGLGSHRPRREGGGGGCERITFRSFVSALGRPSDLDGRTGKGPPKRGEGERENKIINAGQKRREEREEIGVEYK